ncbi:hypothetical protein [Streptomyces sp. NPDC089919]|uniref:hypothetical protein n=1 Tax=Streptomyces sp. NPDC089919 TaxID=3155188 RepID=UPI003423C5D7
MRKLSAAAIATIALCGSSVLTAPAAHAADVQLKSHTWTTVADGKVHAVFNLLDDSGVNPADVTIHVRRPGEAQVLASLGLQGTEGCDDDEGTCWDGTWLTDALKLPGLGVYTMDVFLKEGTPEERVDRDNGELEYGVNAKLALSSDRSWISYDNRRIKTTGVMTAEDPDTHEVKPFPGVEFYYRADGGRGEGRLRTDAAGRFTRTAEFGEYDEAGVSTRYSSDLASGEVQLPFRKQDLKITADTTAMSGPLGGRAPLTGRVVRTADDGTEQPAPGLAVMDDHRTAVAQTGTDGTYKGAVSLSNHTLRLQPELNRWFNVAPTVYVKLSAAKTSTWSGVKGAVDKYRKVTFTGKVGVSSGSYPKGTTAELLTQYSADGRSWSTVDAFQVKYGESFSHSPARKASDRGYWRLDFHWPNLKSPAVKLARKSTQFFNDDLTPEGVRAGTKITAKGGLLQRSGTSWKAFGGQKVRVYFKSTARGAAWQQIASATTKADGTFATKVTARRDGTWQIRYTDTDTGHYAVSGREDYVDVR